MLRVLVRGKLVHITPDQAIGKGGEADVFNIGGGYAAKIFKPPTHPDFAGFPNEQTAAIERIREHQQKLPVFPSNLPSRVITPDSLVTNEDGTQILGYIMKLLRSSEPLLRYGERAFREAGASDDTVVKIFRDLHQTVSAVHDAGVVIGDFNDLNVLIVDDEAYLIDVDSMQFGNFACRLFTATFVDPLLCDPNERKPMLKMMHNEASDWYAYAVMLMNSLLYVGPYGGVYKPSDKTRRIPHDARPLSRITVFDTEVRYPRPARHFSILPDDLLDYFHRVFEKDERTILPIGLLDEIRWTTCLECGTTHARAVCPSCFEAPPSIIRAVATGKVHADKVFETGGTILFATLQNNVLRWVYHEDGAYYREDGTFFLNGPLDPHIKFRIQEENTHIAKGSKATFLTSGAAQQVIVDAFGATLPALETNSSHAYWVVDGQLRRTGKLGPDYPERIGDVLRNQTLFWVGPKFGFGFYRAGNLSQCFIFDAETRGVNDTLTLQPFRGHMIDATCFFSNDHAWFFLANRVGSETINSCYLIRRDGTVEATAETLSGDASWLGTLRGKTASADFLLAPTDDGVVRIRAQGADLVVEKEFPDSARFVHEGRSLFASREGLLVVSGHDIWRLTFNDHGD